LETVWTDRANGLGFVSAKPHFDIETHSGKLLTNSGLNYRSTS